MARISKKSRKVPRGKGKTSRKNPAREGSNKGRMVTRGLGEILETEQRILEKNIDFIHSIEKTPEAGKDGYNVFGVRISEKDKINKIFEERKSSKELFKELNKQPIEITSKRDMLVELEQDRAKIYGDPFLSHQAIGLAWEGVFRNRYHEFVDEYNHIGQTGKLFPADLVAEMLAAFKLIRLSRPVFHQDSADDLHVYVGFSERFRGKK